MSISVTAQGFDELGRKLLAANIPALIEPIVQTAGLNIKKQIQQDASGIRHAPRLKYAISYDVKRSANTVEMQVGPKRGAAGSLAFFWLGNAKIAPLLPHPRKYAEHEAEQTVRYLVIALKKAMG